MPGQAMSSNSSPAPTDDPVRLRLCNCSPDAVRVLAEPTRRAIVDALQTRHTLPVDLLPTTLTPAPSARDLGPPSPGGTSATALRHVHLPVLEDVGAVSYDREEDLVALGSDPDFHEDLLTDDRLTAVEQAVWDAIVAVHGNRRRTALLAQLNEGGEPTSVESLARRLLATDAGGATDRPESGDVLESLKTELHHIHLPKLAAVGLISYDPDQGIATYTADRWFRLPDLLDALRTRKT